jgi:hypothetical protein
MRSKPTVIASLLVLSALLACSGGTPTPRGASSWTGVGVRAFDRSTYYEVTVDYSSGLSPRDMGREYATATLALVPNIEPLLESYLQYLVTQDGSGYPALIARALDLLPQVDADYREELEGFASVLSSGTRDELGDGRLSLKEYYVLVFLNDVMGWRVRSGGNCSGFSVFGTRSATGGTITGRILDWADGDAHQLAKLHAIITIRNTGPKHSVVNIGTLGMIGVMTGFNDRGVFVANLDSKLGVAPASAGRAPLGTDYRHALEFGGTLQDVAAALMIPNRYYTLGHNVLLSDATTTTVLEDDFSGLPGTGRRLRTYDSALNPGVIWGISDAIGVVNSFILKGQEDFHTGVLSNTARWNTIRSGLLSAQGPLGLGEIASLAASHSGAAPGSQEQGDLYNSSTLHIVVFRPEDRSLRVFFRPRDGSLPGTPTFETVPVAF